MPSNISRGNRYKELCQICNLMAWGSPQGTNMGARHRFFYQLPPIVLICRPISQTFRKDGIRVTGSVKVQETWHNGVPGSATQYWHHTFAWKCICWKWIGPPGLQNRVSAAKWKGLIAFFYIFAQFYLHRTLNISTWIISFIPYFVTNWLSKAFWNLTETAFRITMIVKRSVSGDSFWRLLYLVGIRLAEMFCLW